MSPDIMIHTLTQTASLTVSLVTCGLQHIDNLPREKAFFTGPSPVLLSSLTSDDLTFLLLGSDPKTSQVEFGAHQ